MGFLQPISAERLEAIWDFLTQNLTLIAVGQAQKFTAGIKFYPQPQTGPYPSWQLMGWVGPLAQGTEPFEVSQEEPQVETNFVILNGQQIEVKMVFGGEPGPVISTSQLSNGKSSTESPTTVQNAEVVEIDVIYPRPFRISHSAQTDIGGSIRIISDTRYMVLTAASVINNNIVWLFTPAQLGQTEAKVIVSSGLKPMLTSVTYRITIVPPVIPPPTIGTSTAADASKPQLILPYPFELRVLTALAHIKAQYPDAALYNVSNSATEGVSNVDLLNKMVVICRSNTAGGSAQIVSAGFNEWGPVEKGGAVFGNSNIDYPVPVTAEQAWEELHAQAPQLNVKSLILSQHQVPNIPTYYFTLSDDSVHAVPAVQPTA